jgi:hypothetical protein
MVSAYIAANAASSVTLKTTDNMHTYALCVAGHCKLHSVQVLAGALV